MACFGFFVCYVVWFSDVLVSFLLAWLFVSWFVNSFLALLVASCLVCFLLVSTCDLFVFLWFVFGVVFVV